MTDYIHSEEALADILGVPRPTVGAVRSTMLTDEDWRMAGHSVAYSASGVRALLKAMAVRLPATRASVKDGMTVARLLEKSRMETPTDPAPSDPPSPAALTFVSLKVERLTKNRQVLLASSGIDLPCPGTQYSGQERPLLRVRVRDGRRFSPGMEIPCRHVQADLWEFTGIPPRGPHDTRYMPGHVT